MTRKNDIWYILIALFCFMVILVIFCINSHANSTTEDVKKLLNNDMSDITYTITVNPKTKTEEDINIEKYAVGLSESDFKLAQAIIRSFRVGGFFKHGSPPVESVDIYLLVKYARWKYTQDKMTNPFVDFIRKLINDRWANCDGWIEYYKAFLDEKNN